LSTVWIRSRFLVIMHRGVYVYWKGDAWIAGRRGIAIDIYHTLVYLRAQC
jgi:hypothetical protein